MCGFASVSLSFYCFGFIWWGAYLMACAPFDSVTSGPPLVLVMHLRGYLRAVGWVVQLAVLLADVLRISNHSPYVNRFMIKSHKIIASPLLICYNKGR
jgi:hypothetical protein